MKPEKEFWKGTYYFLVLHLLKERGRLHGYAIRKELEPFGKPSESTVYDTLKKLEKEGYIKGTWITDGKRIKKYYEITEKGLGLLDTLSKQLSSLCSLINQVSSNSS
ncbi:MAG: PadR family transcriptional regulator [Crenarchaeota archaeon]|nr:PadR family transcriptional regulator [Thermoproteota archaeon]